MEKTNIVQKQYNKWVSSKFKIINVFLRFVVEKTRLIRRLEVVYELVLMRVEQEMLRLNNLIIKLVHLYDSIR